MYILSYIKKYIKKIGVDKDRFQNLFIFNCCILLTSGSISLFFLYARNASIQNFKLITIIFSRILIKVIMDNENYYLSKCKGIHVSNLMFFRGIINSALFIIFSFVLYFWQNGNKWIFSFLSNMSLDFSGIIFILLKIIYTVSLGNQKFALLTLLFTGNPILASFSYLTYYLHPYISMVIMIVLYDENFQIGPEIIFEVISGLCFLFTLFTSIELINLPCSCLKNGTRSTSSENDDDVEFSINLGRKTDF